MKPLMKLKQKLMFAVINALCNMVYTINISFVSIKLVRKFGSGVNVILKKC